ncbi:MAG: type IVB secretion system lipoprotein DotD [Gammaproteobacteria bacterium]|nr:type IVB secretion system lipoprotein DotD [Gammaproteobacteria bacterium]
MRNRIFLLALAAVFLAGCSQTGQKELYINGKSIGGEVSSIKLAEGELAHSSVAIKNSLLQLAEIKRATHPQVRLPLPPNAKNIGMDKLASIDWTGPIEPLVRDVARVCGYKLRVLGKHPAVPVLVSVHEKNVPIVYILRNAGFQAGNRVNIVLYPRSKILELRYA